MILRVFISESCTPQHMELILCVELLVNAKKPTVRTDPSFTYHTATNMCCWLVISHIKIE